MIDIKIQSWAPRTKWIPFITIPQKDKFVYDNAFILNYDCENAVLLYSNLSKIKWERVGDIDWEKGGLRSFNGTIKAYNSTLNVYSKNSLFYGSLKLETIYPSGENFNVVLKGRHIVNDAKRFIKLVKPKRFETMYTLVIKAEERYMMPTCVVGGVILSWLEQYELFAGS